MLAPIFLVALLLLSGPYFCLSLFASCIPKFTFVPIAVIIFAQYFISKAAHFWRSKKQVVELFYEGRYDFGSKEGNLILGISAMTSWIAPCTVWINRGLPGKQGHLITSAFVTVSAYLMTLLSLGLLTSSNGSFFNGLDTPPIFHCFSSTDHFVNKSFHFSQNTSAWKLLSLSADSSSHKIRICSDQETPFLWLHRLLLIGAGLCAVTQLAAILLFHMSNFSSIYKYLGCSKSFRGLVTEYLFLALITHEEDTKAKLAILEELKRGDEFVRSAQHAEQIFDWRKKISEKDRDLIQEVRDRIISDATSVKVWKCPVQWRSKHENEYEDTIIECPPIHAALWNCRFGWFVLFYLLGGKIDHFNGQVRKPTTLLIYEPISFDVVEIVEVTRMRRSLEKSPFLARMIKYIARKHGGDYVESATRAGDARLLEILVDNGYNPGIVSAEGQQPIHYAARLGEAECLKILIENRADVAAKDSFGQTPLHVAAGAVWYVNEECLRILLENGADINATDYLGKTPLHSALDHGYTECVKFLIENQADLNARDKRGKSPLHFAIMCLGDNKPQLLTLLVEGQADVNAKDNDGRTPLHDATNNGAVECMQVLMNGQADLNARDENGLAPLHVAALTGNTSCEQILIESQADVNLADNFGQTPLHHAAREGKDECLKILIKSQADVGAVDKQGVTPLHYAARNGHPQCVEILISNKAEVNVKDLEGRTPTLFAALNGKTECLKLLIDSRADVNAKHDSGLTPLHFAANMGHLECLNLLIQNGCLVNERSNAGQTPLHFAVFKDQADCLKILIQNGAEVDATDTELRATPLHFAAAQGHTRCLEILIESQADVNAINNHGQTPLHSAAGEGKLECLKLLIAHQANVNAKDCDEEEPMHYAANSGETKCLEILLESGASVNATDINRITPLHVAAAAGQIECLKFLIANRADVDAKDENGNSPLHFAARSGQEESLKVLIGHHADVTTRNNQGETLYDAAIGGRQAFEQSPQFTEDVKRSIAEIFERVLPMLKGIQ